MQNRLGDTPLTLLIRNGTPEKLSLTMKLLLKHIEPSVLAAVDHRG